MLKHIVINHLNGKNASNIQNHQLYLAVSQWVGRDILERAVGCQNVRAYFMAPIIQKKITAYEYVHYVLMGFRGFGNDAKSNVERRMKRKLGLNRGVYEALVWGLGLRVDTPNDSVMTASLNPKP